MMEKALSLSGRNSLDYDFMIVTYAAILIKSHQHRYQCALAILNPNLRIAHLALQAWIDARLCFITKGELAAARTYDQSESAQKSTIRRCRMLCGGSMLFFFFFFFFFFLIPKCPPEGGRYIRPKRAQSG